MMKIYDKMAISSNVHKSIKASANLNAIQRKEGSLLLNKLVAYVGFFALELRKVKMQDLHKIRMDLLKKYRNDAKLLFTDSLLYEICRQHV